MNIVVIITAILLLVLIGTENALIENAGKSVALALHYTSELLVIASLGIVLYYYSKYGKTDTFLTNVEFELSDVGYYKTKRSENTVDDYYKAVREDLIGGAFSISENLELTEMDFALRGTKRGGTWRSRAVSSRFFTSSETGSKSSTAHETLCSAKPNNSEKKSVSSSVEIWAPSTSASAMTMILS